MTSSNGNFFRVTGPLCGEFTGLRWRGALMFSLIYACMNGWVNNHNAGDLRRHRCHYDVTVMASSRRQSITWTSDDPVYWCIYVWPSLDELILFRLFLFHDTHNMASTLIIDMTFNNNDIRVVRALTFRMHLHKTTNESWEYRYIW